MTAYRVYVASGLENITAAKELIQILDDHYFEITYDWTKHGSLQLYPDRWMATAKAEADGVIDCDALIALMPGGLGTHSELGIAIASHKRILLIGDLPRSRICIFHWHPNVTRVQNQDTALAMLQSWRRADFTPSGVLPCTTPSL